MMRIIAPDVLKNSSLKNRKRQKDLNDIIEEHKEIAHHIISKNPKESKNAIRKHLRSV